MREREREREKKKKKKKDRIGNKKAHALLYLYKRRSFKRQGVKIKFHLHATRTLGLELTLDATPPSANIKLAAFS